LILSTEGSDPCLPLIVEEYISGSSTFIITRRGEKFALCSSIDGAGIEASGVFDRLITFRLGLGETLKEMLLELNPRQIALNFSKNDGL